MYYPEPIYLDETVSTNSFLKELCDRQKQKDFTCVYTAFQSAGRGQRGNSWESERGKNLLFSFVVYPDFLEASRQFLLSQVTALGLRDMLSEYTEDITIKWPNDIYWKDKKICGTLIENDLTGIRTGRSISGTGINLNQEKFLSNAPNPVSLKQITGNDYDPKKILEQTMEHITGYFDKLKAGRTERISTEYMRNLYRGNGLFPYRDGTGTFLAHITDVEPEGRLVLTDEDGNIRKFMFKEVEYILP